MEEKKENLVLGTKEWTCEYCREKIGTKEDDYHTSDVENCEIYVHKDCLERAKMLSKIDWGED